MIKKKGFTLVEILAVTAITGILVVGTAIGVNRLWQNNRIDICESELRDFSNSLKSYFTDYGAIKINADSNYENVVNETVELLNSKYLSCDTELDGISDDKKSFRIKTKLKEDPWGNRYEFDIYTYSGTGAESKTGLAIISSCGPDSKSNKTEYKNGNYGDDIIAVINPN